MAQKSGVTTPDASGVFTPGFWPVTPDRFLVNFFITPDAPGVVTPDRSGIITPDTSGIVTPDAPGVTTPGYCTFTPDANITPGDHWIFAPDVIYYADQFKIYHMRRSLELA